IRSESSPRVTPGSGLPPNSAFEPCALAPVLDGARSSQPPTLIAGVRPPSTTFGLVLLVHIPAGATAFINGPIGAASPKQRGRHPNAGRIYIVALSVVFVTATATAAMRWSEDAYLFFLGSISFSLGPILDTQPARFGGEAGGLSKGCITVTGWLPVQGPPGVCLAPLKRAPAPFA